MAADKISQLEHTVLALNGDYSLVDEMVGKILATFSFPWARRSNSPV